MFVLFFLALSFLGTPELLIVMFRLDHFYHFGDLVSMLRPRPKKSPWNTTYPCFKCRFTNTSEILRIQFIKICKKFVILLCVFDGWNICTWNDRNRLKQAMMTLQGMADHRFTSVSLSTNVFLGEIIFFPLNIQCTSKYQTLEYWQKEK